LSVRNEDAANNPTLVLFKNINSASSEDIFRVQSWNGSFNTVASIKANGAATFSSSITASTGTFSSTGIGITNSQLVVRNTTSAAALITFENTANGHSFGFSSAGTGGQRFSFFNGAPTEIAYITSSGASTFLGDLSLMNASGDIHIRMKDSSGNADRVLLRQASTNDVYIGDIDANNGKVIIRTNGNDAVTITSGGNLLIGTETDSGGRLQVNGGSFRFNWSNPASSNYLWINRNSTQDGGFLLTKNNVLDWQINNTGSSGDLIFYSYGIGNPALTLTRATGAASFASTVTANNLITSTQGLNVSGYGFLNQTLSGQMTILGHNVSASSSVNNQTYVVNGGWYSSMIKMYYSEGITFHTSSTVYSSGAVYPMGDTERVKIQTDGQVVFQSSIILRNGQINSLTSGGSGQSMYLNFQGNGTVYAGSSYTVLYSGSDERIKTEINHSQSTLSKILNLIPRTFKYKERPELTYYGFIAQEVEKVMPELVRVSEGITMCLDEEIENQKSVESYGLVWASILVKAIQELKAELDELKSKN